MVLQNEKLTVDEFLDKVAAASRGVSQPSFAHKHALLQAYCHMLLLSNYSVMFCLRQQDVRE